MKIHLSPIELQARAMTDLRSGVPIVLKGEESLLVFACETIQKSRLDALKAMPDAAIVLTDWRAKTLKAPVYDGKITRISLPSDTDIRWVRAMADPSLDLSNPMKGPFKAIRGGDISTHMLAIELAKASQLLPAVIVVPADEVLDQTLTTLDFADFENIALSRVTSAALPLAVSEASRLSIFRPGDAGEEHYAIEIGEIDRSQPVLVRLHSACFTGDVLGSLKCDCGPQLHGALEQMGAQNSGVLLYLNQEGRGIGLANKMRAYELQSQGFDTVEANHRLGFEDDERRFEVGATILKELGIERVNLLTNNPSKIERLEKEGIKVVSRIPLKIQSNPHNQYYLNIKSEKSGHLL